MQVFSSCSFGGVVCASADRTPHINSQHHQCLMVLASLQLINPWLAHGCPLPQIAHDACLASASVYGSRLIVPVLSDIVLGTCNMLTASTCLCSGAYLVQYKVLLPWHMLQLALSRRRVHHSVPLSCLHERLINDVSHQQCILRTACDWSNAFMHLLGKRV